MHLLNYFQGAHCLAATPCRVDPLFLSRPMIGAKPMAKLMAKTMLTAVILRVMAILWKRMQLSLKFAQAMQHPNKLMPRAAVHQLRPVNLRVLLQPRSHLHQPLRRLNRLLPLALWRGRGKYRGRVAPVILTSSNPAMFLTS